MSASAVIDGRRRKFFGMASSLNNLMCSLTGSSPPRYVLPIVTLHCGNKPGSDIHGEFDMGGGDRNQVQNSLWQASAYTRWQKGVRFDQGGVEGIHEMLAEGPGSPSFCL